MLTLIQARADRLFPTITDIEIDRVRLLAAIATVESNGGRDWRMNYEPAFDVGGSKNNEIVRGYQDKWSKGIEDSMLDNARSLVCCSWGPWQMLAIAAYDLGYDQAPWMLAEPLRCLAWCIRYLNVRVSKRPEATTVEGLVCNAADAYNSGTHLDKYKPTQYIGKVLDAYNSPDTLKDLVVYG